MAKEYPEMHQKGITEVNKTLLDHTVDFTEVLKGDFGIQIAKDGRVWICINGESFIRFKPKMKKIKKD